MNQEPNKAKPFTGAGLNIERQGLCHLPIDHARQSGPICFFKSAEARGQWRLWLAPIIAFSSLLTAAPPAAAQYARIYANVPKNSNILELPLSSTHADKSANDDQPSELKTRFNSATIIYVRTFAGFTGNSAGVGVVVPTVSILGYNTTTGEVTQDQSGFGDPSFTLDDNIFGAKAMSPEEFARTPAQTYAGLHGVFMVPWGSYQSSQPNNIGSNRYSFKLTFNYTRIWNDGATQLDNYFSGQVFDDNDGYLGSSTLSQKALCGYQVYLSHNLSLQVYLEVGAIGAWGGAVTIDGVQQSDSQNTWKGVIGFGTKTWKGGSIIGTFTQTIVRSSDDPKIQAIMFDILQVF